MENPNTLKFNNKIDKKKSEISNQAFHVCLMVRRANTAAKLYEKETRDRKLSQLMKYSKK